MTERIAKQIIVMRTDLNMRKGKMIAQGAHASIAFLTSKIGNKPWTSDNRTWHQPHVDLSEAEKAWIEGRFTKICVRVDSEEELLEIHHRAQEAGLTSYLIEDAGLTEFDGVPTNTCVGIGPDFEEKIDPITGHLRLL
jgi:PTH2 family peptidyl-tRNA hydrolase